MGRMSVGMGGVGCAGGRVGLNLQCGHYTCGPCVSSIDLKLVEMR